MRTDFDENVRKFLNTNKYEFRYQVFFKVLQKTILNEVLSRGAVYAVIWVQVW